MAEGASQVAKKSIAAIILLEILQEDERRQNRRGKTRGWIRKREEKGYVNNTVQELMIKDTPGYREMMRMTHNDFLEILRLVEPDITHRQVTGGHKVISAAERLTLTIGFLATG